MRRNPNKRPFGNAIVEGIRSAAARWMHPRERGRPSVLVTETVEVRSA
jgi:hypothetical protein